MREKRLVIITGFAGLLAAILVGIGEFLLHYDPSGRYGQGLSFLKDIPEIRATTGHFIAVLGAPLYVLGAWHIHLMLRPANRVFSLIAFLLMSYGLMIGAVWIGSRASAVTIVNLEASVPLIQNLLSLYDLRYESLLSVTRIAILAMSVIFIWLCLTGRSHYPRWMAAINPLVLIMFSFAVFALAPEIGKYIMPIALNVAFFILFATSLLIADTRLKNGAD